VAIRVNDELGNTLFSLRWLPITDLSCLHYALVWRTETETAITRAMAQVVNDLGPLLR
jgi:hypothetical protein